MITPPKMLLVATNRDKGIYLSFGVYLLDAWISQKLLNKIEIRIADDNCDNTRKIIREWKPDIVGISFTSAMYKHAQRLSEFCMDLESPPIVIAGGVHVSALPRETMASNHSYFDYAFIGEAEKPLTEFLRRWIENRDVKNWDLADIPGICFLDFDGGVYVNKAFDYVENLDEIPQLNYYKINMKYFLRKNMMIRGFPAMRTFAMLPSRGCPYRCHFCSSAVVSKRIVRYQSAESIFNVISFLHRSYGIEAVYFHDDLFISNKKRLLDFCDKMISSGMADKVKWCCQARSEVVLNLEEHLDMIRKAGCIQFEFGFETGNDRVLRLLKGGNSSVDISQKALDVTWSHGIKVFGNFMVANHTETLSEIQDTINFIKRNNDKLNFFGVYNAYPLPATPWWEALKAEGRDLSHFDFEASTETEHNPHSYSELVTDADLRNVLSELQVIGYQKIPLKQRVMWMLITGIKDPIRMAKRVLSYAMLLLRRGRPPNQMRKP